VNNNLRAVVPTTTTTTTTIMKSDNSISSSSSSSSKSGSYGSGQHTNDGHYLFSTPYILEPIPLESIVAATGERNEQQQQQQQQHEAQNTTGNHLHHYVPQHMFYEATFVGDGCVAVATSTPEPKTGGIAALETTTTATPSSSPQLPQLPIAPGHEIVLRDPITGVDRRYKVEYRYYEMRRDEAGEFIQRFAETIIPMPQAIMQQSQEIAAVRINSPTSGSDASPTTATSVSTTATTTSTVTRLTSPILPPTRRQSPSYFVPQAPPTVSLPEGWGWCWQNGSWTLWKNDDGPSQQQHNSTSTTAATETTTGLGSGGRSARETATTTNLHKNNNNSSNSNNKNDQEDDSSILSIRPDSPKTFFH
jgi:hypothetical protein